MLMGLLTTKLETREEGPTVYLFVGVNGVGKTTTIAKLANRFVKDGKKVLLVAGDTFRAGAYQQLKEWSERTGAYFYGREGATDPSSVIYEGCELALKENYDYVFIDTAGRLQNKANLMKELEKMNRVINKLIPNSPTETLLVLDASTGQNGIKQAISFKEITNITGIVLTKMDGTAKGGIVLAIKEEVGVPVKFIGFGERAEDLQEFDIEQYIYGLFKRLHGGKMKKSITKINPKAKERNKNNTKLFITIQFILTILLLVFGILSLIYKDLFFYFKLLLGITIIDMGINNQLIYKRLYATYVYLGVGVIILLVTFFGA